MTMHPDRAARLYEAGVMSIPCRYAGWVSFGNDRAQVAELGVGKRGILIRLPLSIA